MIKDFKKDNKSINNAKNFKFLLSNSKNQISFTKI